MSAPQQDVYGETIEIGDFVIKSAGNFPDYAIILDFVEKQPRDKSYSWTEVKIVSNLQKSGDTFDDRLLKVKRRHVPKTIRNNLLRKFTEYYNRDLLK